MPLQTHAGRKRLPYFFIMMVALLLGWLFYNQTYRVVKDVWPKTSWPCCSSTNFQERSLPLVIQQLFYYEIVSSLVKLQEQLLTHDPADTKRLLQLLSATDG